MRETQQLTRPENTAVINRAATPFFPARVVQPKLQVNAPGDVYEQEADAMADRVMRMSGPANNSSFFKPATAVQRKCQHCEEEQKLQRKENSEVGAQGGDELDNYVASLGSSGKPLPDSSRQFFEPRFGSDFSGVKLHTDAAAAKSAQSINALAYTTGNNIVFNQGQFSPDSESGKRLIAHELTHVVQQSGKGTQPVQRWPGVPATVPSAKAPDPTDASQLASSCTMHFEQGNTFFTNKGEFRRCKHAIIDYLKIQPDNRIILNGFASDEGTPTFNMDLSKRRAERVLGLLKDEHVDISRVKIVAHGADSTFPSKTEAGRAKNRRVEVVEYEDFTYDGDVLEGIVPKCPTTSITGCLPITLFSDTKHCGTGEDFSTALPTKPLDPQDEDKLRQYKDLPDDDLLGLMSNGFDGIANLGGAPGKAAAQHFYGGSGTPVNHDIGTPIGAAASKSSAFNDAATDVETAFHAMMVKMSITPSINNCGTLINSLKAPHVNFPASKWQIMKAEFSDSDRVMLKAVIGGTHGVEITLTAFKVDCDARNYEATLHYRMCDNFGVDDTDLYTGSLYAFWVLQHMRTGHKPFINNILLDRKISKSFY